MKKLLLLFLLIPLMSIGQKKQKGIIWDSDMLHYKSVDEIIDYNSKMNFTLVSKMFDYGNSTEVVYQNPKDSDYYMNNISYHFIKIIHPEPHYYTYLYEHLPTIENRSYISRVVTIKKYY